MSMFDNPIAWLALDAVAASLVRELDAPSHVDDYPILMAALTHVRVLRSGRAFNETAALIHLREILAIRVVIPPKTPKGKRT